MIQNKSETILRLIENKKPIKSSEFVLKKITADGNCFYRSVSSYYTNSEIYHSNIRELIYEYALNNKDLLKPFFLGRKK